LLQGDKLLVWVGHNALVLRYINTILVLFFFDQLFQPFQVPSSSSTADTPSKGTRLKPTVAGERLISPG
jgi:hypothetical protein